MRGIVCLGVLCAAVAAGCGEGAGTLRVFAAASLSEVLTALDPEAAYNFGGSDELAVQIRSGADADVYLAAASSHALGLLADGLVEEPRVFATNRLVIVVPRANSGRIEEPADLLRPGVRLVLGAEGVPVGDYAREALATLGLQGALANVVSEEPDVKGVVAKVSLGAADAGVVYATDVGPVADDVTVIELPQAAQPRIEYVVTVLRRTDHAEAARRFVEHLLGREGRAALQAAGFGVP